MVSMGKLGLVINYYGMEVIITGSSEDCNTIIF